MNDISKTCIVCNAEMTQSESWLYSCPKCGFLHSSLQAGAGTGVDGLEYLRRLNFEIILKKLGKITTLNDKLLLEVGCSTGIFLEQAKNTGIKAVGLEPEKNKAYIARTNNFDVIDGFFPDDIPQAQKYDIIIFNDVFEHLPDPIAAINACYDHLNANGLLIINIPNSSGFLYQLSKILNYLGINSPFERLWQKQFSSPHITYFHSKNLREFVESRTALRLIESSRLKSMTSKGLKARIKSSISEPLASIAFVPIAIVCAIQNFLPSDILLHIYKKSGS